MPLQAVDKDSNGSRWKRFSPVLAARIFVLNNTHDDAPEVFESRWAMSYLRGPLTRVQIKELMAASKGQAPAPPIQPAPVSASPSITPLVVGEKQEDNQRPVLPAEVTQYFLPIRSTASSGERLTYQPMIMGAAEIHYSDSRTIDMTQQLTMLSPVSEGPIALDWGQASVIDVPVEELETDSESNASFGTLPSAASKVKNYQKWSKELATWIYRNQKIELFESPSLDVASNPGESERDFRVRLQQFARESRDKAVEKLRQRYVPKIAKLEEKKWRAEQIVQREAEQAQSQKYQTAISFGATLLSSFLGRKKASLGTIGRATTAARGVSRSMKEAGDVTRAQETLTVVNQQLLDLDGEFQAEARTLELSIDPQTEQLEKVSLKPKKTNISVKLLTFVWAPFWKSSDGKITPAW